MQGKARVSDNRAQSADGRMVRGAPDELYGKPVDLVLARTIFAVATLRGWAIEAGDVEGAYLTAPLRGPAVYMRLSAALWDALGVPQSKVADARDPCVKLDKALYGLPRAGFDWFASLDELLTRQLG